VLNEVAKLVNDGKQEPNAGGRGPRRGGRAEAQGRASPPIPCSYRLENIERRAVPAVLDFNMRSLIV